MMNGGFLKALLNIVQQVIDGHLDKNYPPTTVRSNSRRFVGTNHMPYFEIFLQSVTLEIPSSFAA